MKRILNKKSNTLCAYSFLIISLEIIFKLLMFHRINLDSILYTIIFSLPIILFFTILTNFFREKINKIIFYVSLFLITFLYLFQYVFYRLFSVTFSFHTIGLANQAADFSSIIIDSIKMYYLEILAMIAPLIIILIFRRLIKFYKLIKQVKIMGLVIFLILIGLSILSLGLNKDGLYSAYNLYYKVNAEEKNIEKFGLLTAMRLDIEHVVFGFDESFVMTSAKKDDDQKDKEKIVAYNVSDLDFKALSENESNNNLKKLYSYFDSVSPTNQNDYTGYFKGKNLVFILAEGFNSIAVSEELTPNLYKLVNNGFVFNNYYSPVFLSTTGGEFQATTGLIPNQEILKVWKSRSPKISYALGNQFSKLGYNVNAYHDWTYSYYDRHKTMLTLGYNNYLACHNGLEKEMSCKWLPSDDELMNVTVPKYSDSEQFMTYYVSVSGHAPYNFGGGNSMAVRNKSLVKDLPYSDAVKAYIASQIEFDKSIGTLIQKLEEAGKLDDTVIVITGDHYPYTLSTDEINEVSSYKRDGIVEVNHSNLIIWNNQMEKPIVIDKVGSQIDVLPTLLNLFGIDYDSRLIVGKDILSDAPGLAIFSNRSWVSDKGTYFASGKKFVPKDGVTVDDDYVENMNVEVANRFTVSGQIINNNIYSKLLGE
ncbi:MAG: sulfatase-like hydrolase/transferase [Bacilli bacterium]|nr:sulfatase-like hydrolase/transferase [Bacilli bacterium]